MYLLSSIRTLKNIYLFIYKVDINFVIEYIFFELYF